MSWEYEVTEKKLGALTILSFIIGSPIVVAFITWLSLGVVEASKKNGEQDVRIDSIRETLREIKTLQEKMNDKLDRLR